MFTTAASNIGMYQPVTVKYLIRNQSRHLVDGGDGDGKYLASGIPSHIATEIYVSDTVR